MPSTPEERRRPARHRPRKSRGGRGATWLLVLAMVVAVAGGIGIGVVSTPTGTAAADGPAPCTTGDPPYPYAGFCATYSGDNTWYGSYGPGFPTAQGWAFCADPPASGGDYPAPDYDYVAGGAPAGADTADDNALGFAFGQAEAAGWWSGSPGVFSADQAAAAGKILYDAVVWGDLVPSLDPGTLAAFDDLDDWFDQAAGTTGTPVMTTGIVGGGDSFTTSASYEVHVQFPGTGTGLDGLGVLLSITNGTFDSSAGPSFVGVSTNASGNVVVPIFATGTGTVTVDVSTVTQVGQVGIGFYHPTVGELSAQFLAGFPAPVDLESSQQLTAQVTPPEGTVSVDKTGNDSAYWGVGGAQFEVVDGSGDVLATLATGPDGTTPPSGEIPAGSYTVHESVAPPGYQPAPDQSVTVAPDANTVVAYTASSAEQIIPATVAIAKADAQTGAPLAGAVFDVRYDPSNDGTYSEDLGTCTTDDAGDCSPAGNDGGDLLPGDYQITEVDAPPGYYLDPATATQDITLLPGEAGSVTFADFLLGSLQIDKTGDDTAYVPVAGATFTVTGPAPSTTVVGTLTVGADGASGTLPGLGPGTYTVTETAPPPGYQAVPPVQVAVADGQAATVVDVLDQVQPATLTLRKVDRQTGAPLAGAVLDVRYDPSGHGTYSDDLGTCTTDAAGDCEPAGNDGSGLLPGDYQVTEVTAPPGYDLDPTTATQDVVLAPGQVGEVSLSDPLFVSASFEKVATGNVDTATAGYAGAVIDVTSGSESGPEVATCTTDGSGRCSTPAVLLSGASYCWDEPIAPLGLAPGASGCFVATNDLAAQPIMVSDPGEFVAIAAKKVDAAAPSVGLPGAVFDLFRIDGGTGPDQPTPPPGAPTEAGETWVAQATSGPSGLASFPLQYPGYAYCVVEQTAPANYVADPTPRCTAVLEGGTATPPPVTVVTAPDTEATVTLEAYKYNSLTPGTGIPGATYDLYVEGTAPPSGVPASPPPDVATEPGDTWYERGTTGTDGRLSFTVPAGYAWCLHEVSAPVDYVLDPALDCTGVLTTSSPPATTTVALPESLATVYLTADKYDSLQPGTVIPDATYELLALGPVPPGYADPSPPAGAPVPDGDHYWSEGTTDSNGLLSFAVPAGYSWCLHELVAPPAYQPDPGYHCTGVVTDETPAAAATIALPEVPVAQGLAFTGWSGWWLAPGGTVLLLAGAGLLLLARAPGPGPGLTEERGPGGSAAPGGGAAPEGGGAGGPTIARSGGRRRARRLRRAVLVVVALATLAGAAAVAWSASGAGAATSATSAEPVVRGATPGC